VACVIDHIVVFNQLTNFDFRMFATLDLRTNRKITQDAKFLRRLHSLHFHLRTDW